MSITEQKLVSGLLIETTDLMQKRREATDELHSTKLELLQTKYKLINTQEELVCFKRIFLNKVTEELKIARETNRRLNRRVQKLEQRINRWESRRYTINRWRQWLISWYRAEKARADRLEKELQKYRTPSIWNIWYKK